MAVRLFRRLYCVALLAVATMFACVNSTIAEGFRIETKVFVGEAKEASERNDHAVPQRRRLRLS